MFSYEEIQKYNETDIRIYKYIVSDIDKIQYMTIRELAKELQVSTSTILRFCNKNNFDGYSEFKEALKSLEDHLDIDDFYKTGAYASLYKSYGETVDEIKADDVTVTIMREARPD